MEPEVKHNTSVPNKSTQPRARRPLTLLSKFTKKDVIIAIIIFLFAALFTFRYYSASSSVNQSSQIKTAPIDNLKKGTPDFKTVTPDGNSINTLGGWTRVSPPSSEPVFAYTDKIGNISVIVSQQPLPSKLQTNTDQQVEQLAQGFNADQKIIAGNTTAYVGTSVNGPQSVIFNKGNLLILIKSNTKIADSEWSKYISSLK